MNIIINFSLNYWVYLPRQLKSNSWPRVMLTLKICGMMGMFGVYLRNSIVNANPFIPVIVCSHQIVQHFSSLRKQLNNVSSAFCIFRVFFCMHHLKNNPFTHHCYLDCRTSYISWVFLIFFDSFCNSILENFRWRRVLKAKNSSDHLIWIRQFFCSKVTFIPKFTKNNTVEQCFDSTIWKNPRRVLLAETPDFS